MTTTPTTSTGSTTDHVRAEIAREDREDCRADLRTLRVCSETYGPTIDTPGGRIALEAGALRDIAGWCDAAHAAPFLTGVFGHPERVASARDMLDTLIRTAPAREVLIRSRNNPRQRSNAPTAERSAYAIRSDAYAVDMGAVVALDAIDVVATRIGADVVATYDPTTTRVVATYETANLPASARGRSVGDVLRGGARVTTDDRGGASLATAAYVLRILCLNGMTGMTGQKPSRLRHTANARGFDTRKFTRHVEAAIRNAREAGRVFDTARGVDLWEMLAQRDPTTPPSITAVVEAITTRNAPAIPGVGRADVVAAIVGGWHRQPYTADASARHTLADVANAATYAAHATEWAGASRWTAKPALEAYGGALLRLTARTAM